MKKLPKHIEEYREEIRGGKEKVLFEWYQTESFPAQWVLQAYVMNCCFPVGTVWTDASVKHGRSIANIYVVDDYRRLGIASRLVNKIFNSWDKEQLKVITTDSVNEFSTKWAINCGFVQDSVMGWVLTRKNWLKSPVYKKYFFNKS